MNVDLVHLVRNSWHSEQSAVRMELASTQAKHKVPSSSCTVRLQPPPPSIANAALLVDLKRAKQWRTCPDEAEDELLLDSMRQTADYERQSDTGPLRTKTRPRSGGGGESAYSSFPNEPRWRGLIETKKRGGKSWYDFRHAIRQKRKNSALLSHLTVWCDLASLLLVQIALNMHAEMCELISRLCMILQKPSSWFAGRRMSGHGRAELCSHDVTRLILHRPT